MNERKQDMLGGEIFMPPLFGIFDNRIQGQAQFLIDHSFSIVHFSGNLFLTAMSCTVTTFVSAISRV